MNLKTIWLSISLVATAPNLFAQTDSTELEKVFTKVEKPFGFPGGQTSWDAFLKKNLQYPKKARRKHMEGIVKVQFEISNKGAISNIKVLEDPGGGLAKEAVRLIKLSGSWIPPEQGGRPVRYRHIQNIYFSLSKAISAR